MGAADRGVRYRRWHQPRQRVSTLRGPGAPLKDRLIDQTDMKIITTIREVTADSVKQQAKRHIDAAITTLKAALGE